MPKNLKDFSDLTKVYWYKYDAENGKIYKNEYSVQTKIDSNTKVIKLYDGKMQRRITLNVINSHRIDGHTVSMYTDKVYTKEELIHRISDILEKHIEETQAKLNGFLFIKNKLIDNM